MKTAKARLFCDIFFLVALLFKVFSLGVNYFPVLDDYIQYGGYPLYDELSHVYLTIGTIATRPFASLADPAVWGQMYPHLWVALIAITLLFFFGAKFLAKVLERLGIYATPFLYAVLLLAPIGFEGTYWISASSRICVGLFFAGIASFLLIKFIDTKKKWYVVPYGVATLLSFGFYESVMVMSTLLQLTVILALVKDNKKRAAFLITPVALGIAMLFYYKLAGNIGATANRTSGFTFDNLGDKVIEFFRQLTDIFTVQSAKIIFFGAYSGLKLLASSGFGIVLLIFAVVISLGCGYFGGKQKFSVPAKLSVPVGIALFILPLSPNLLVADVWLTLRSIVTCLIGLVLISAPVFNKVFNKQFIRSAVIFVIVLLFSLGNVSELDTYRRVNEMDNRLVNEICEQLDEEVLSGEKETVVVLDSEVIIPQISYYKDHVKSVFDSDWALTGAVRAKMRNIKIKMITPVFEEPDVPDKQIIYIGGNYGK